MTVGMVVLRLADRRLRVTTPATTSTSSRTLEPGGGADHGGEPIETELPGLADLTFTAGTIPAS